MHRSLFELQQQTTAVGVHYWVKIIAIFVKTQFISIQIFQLFINNNTTKTDFNYVSKPKQCFLRKLAALRQLFVQQLTKIFTNIHWFSPMSTSFYRCPKQTKYLSKLVADAVSYLCINYIHFFLIFVINCVLFSPKN